MTPQHIILAVVAASCASALAMFYWCEFGKGGIRDLANWLDAEVEQGVKLLKENEKLRKVASRYEKLLIEHRDLCAVFHPELSTAGNQEGASGHPGHVDTLASSSLWNCAELGHRYVTATNINGEATWKCLYCPQDGGSAA